MVLSSFLGTDRKIWLAFCLCNFDFWKLTRGLVDNNNSETKNNKVHTTFHSKSSRARANRSVRAIKSKQNTTKKSWSFKYFNFQTRVSNIASKIIKERKKFLEHMDILEASATIIKMTSDSYENFKVTIIPGKTFVDISYQKYVKDRVSNFSCREQG